MHFKSSLRFRQAPLYVGFVCKSAGNSADSTRLFGADRAVHYLLEDGPQKLARSLAEGKSEASRLRALRGNVLAL